MSMKLVLRRRDRHSKVGQMPEDGTNAGEDSSPRSSGTSQSRREHCAYHFRR
jgi:hypothetical protein